MIGFDRPLKPLWIYKFIQIVDVGHKISSYKDKFNELLWELDGEEGKRKVRTVLSRYFLKAENNSRSNLVENSTIIEICKRYPIEEIKPLLLYYLLIRSQVLRTLTKLMYDLYGPKEDINYSFVRKKIVEKFGDRDISARSLRNFLSTLESFDILKVNKKNYKWNSQMEINEMNLCYMLKFYANDYKKSPFIIFEDIEEYLFMYFKMPEIIKVVKKYQGKLWEYSVRVNQRIILIDNKFNWSTENIYKIFYGNR